MTYITGWITPSRKFVECQMYEHLGIVTKDDEFRKAIGDKIDEWKATLDYVETECNVLIAQGEHPEWHAYEITESRATHDLRKQLYQKGFVRVGTKGKTLYFEGKHGIRNLMQFCKDFAEERDMDYEFEKV